MNLPGVNWAMLIFDNLFLLHPSTDGLFSVGTIIMKPQNAFPSIDLATFENSCPYITFGKGEQLFAQNAISHFNVTSNRIYAKVQGTQLYDVEVVYDDEDGSTEYFCDCPAAKRYNICKHAIAVVLKYVKDQPYLVGDKGQTDRELVTAYFQSLSKDELVSRLFDYISNDRKQWNALVTQLKMKDNGMSLTQVRRKIHEAIPDVDWAYDDYDEKGYFDDANTLLAPIWENLKDFSIAEQWELLVMIRNKMNEVIPSFHYGDQTGITAENLEKHMPKVLQQLPWSDEEKIEWLMEHAVINREDYLELDDALIEPYQSHPHLIVRCKEALNKLPKNASSWSHYMCAEIVKNNSKDLRDILVVKKQMARHCHEFIDICQFYLDNNEPLEAEHYLLQIRKDFPAQHEQIECDRMEIKIRTQLGELKSGWRIANDIFDKAPSFREYQTLMKTKQDLNIEDDNVLFQIEARLIEEIKKRSFIAHELLEVYMAEKEYRKGLDVIKAHKIKSSFQLRFFKETFDFFPQDALNGYIASAAEKVKAANNKSYQMAINILVDLDKNIQGHPLLRTTFAEKVTAIATENKAKRNFIKLFSEHFPTLWK